MITDRDLRALSEEILKLTKAVEKLRRSVDELRRTVDARESWTSTATPGPFFSATVGGSDGIPDGSV